nr:hypothetical protein [Hahella ganghwensis]
MVADRGNIGGYGTYGHSRHQTESVMQIANAVLLQHGIGNDGYCGRNL